MQTHSSTGMLYVPYHYLVSGNGKRRPLYSLRIIFLPLPEVMVVGLVSRL